MKYVEIILSYISILLNLYALYFAYSTLEDNPKKANIRIIISLIFIAIITYLSNTYLASYYKLPIILISNYMLYKITYKEKSVITLTKLILTYLILLICDFLFSTVFIFIKVDSIFSIKTISLFKAGWTILISILLILIFKFKPLVRFLKKIINYMFESTNRLFIIGLFLLASVFIALTYITALNFDSVLFLISLVLIIIFIFLLVVVIRQYFKNKENKKDQENLKELMNEYEKILEKDRINRHEMLNNLIVLKSYKNKSSKRYEQILDDIIKDYQNKKEKTYTSLYKLPKGIKGIVYYKISNMTDNDIEFTTVISEEANNKIESMNSKLYYIVCKILGILLDNAIEASKDSKDKQIMLEIYNEDDISYIYLENSFKGNVKLDEIKKKGYSTKGKNRGLGLHIVNRLIKSNKNLELTQEVNKNRFMSTLRINTK